MTNRISGTAETRAVAHDVGPADAGTVRFGRLVAMWGSCTDRGKLRPVNEDAVLQQPGLWAVADGMGGHAAGDVASALAVSTLAELSGELPLAAEAVVAAIQRANARIRAGAHERGAAAMGTTIVGAALVDDGAGPAVLVFNVGDSRCYELAGQLVQLTTDHSVVQELVDQGLLRPEDARLHPDRNIVTRALGVEDTVQADILVTVPEGRRRLLLCSDGVSNELDHAAIHHCLATVDDPQHAATALVELVLQGSARDNATALVLDLQWDAPGDPMPERDPEVTGPRPNRVASGAASQPELIAEVPRD